MSALQMELHTERKARLVRMGMGPRANVVRLPAPAPLTKPEPIKQEPIKQEPAKVLWFRLMPQKAWFVVLAEGMFRTKPDNSGGLRIDEIQRVVAEHFGVTVIDIRSERRTARVVRPRQISMYLCRKLTTKSLPEVGRRAGGKDHTTVLHAVAVCNRILKHSEKYADDIRELSDKLEPYAR